MRILKILSFLQMAGTELSAIGSAQALAEAGHTIFVVHNRAIPFNFDFFEEELSIPDIFVKRFNFGASRCLGQIFAFIERAGVDVIHFHTDVATIVSTALVSKYPTIYTRHVPLCPNGTKYRWKLREACPNQPSIAVCFNGYIKFGCGTLGNGQKWSPQGFARSLLINNPNAFRQIRSYTKVVAVSREHCAELRADVGQELNVSYVPEPIVRSCEIPTSLNGEGSKIYRKYIFAAGRLVEFKGFADLIETVKMLPHDVNLIIAGEGPDRLKLESLTQHIGVEKRVRFLGAVSSQVMNELYAGCLLCVVPSRWRETFCRVGVEAMSFSKPVIAYNQGGVKDWLSDGLNGYAIPPGDIDGLTKAIKYAVSNPELLRVLGEHGKSMSMEWTYERHASVLTDVFQEAGDKFHESRN